MPHKSNILTLVPNAACVIQDHIETTMTITYTVCETLDDVVKCIAVRCIVFCGEQNISYLLERDEHDAGAMHILGTIDGEPIAVGRLRYLNGYAKLERIAVRAPWRGEKYGLGITQFMIDTARQQGFTTFKLNAQAHLESFYAKLGFRVAGEHFMEAGIDHCPMKLVLAPAS
jgi:predicted GNAT family N-acyltransferase